MKNLLVILLCCGLWGCTTISPERQAWFDFNFNNPHNTSQLHIGMTKQEVLDVWGDVYHPNKSVTQYGTSEQWVYGTYAYGGRVKYLYFNYGILTGWQE